ncbi:uncharacterized protein E0L32_007087 [Thyridium curvatum]|uniref:Uncharacterized protein n=1 Tax=Thyridium curvatum TaxID=1093900 RepID=A0A507B571_9PEZI|nr:uncharacterized protein E0L32_007087 [Thyridium curvatum]TPX12201.1 hypothetical protein E0L32_007087 [Thyridium curvatum]
MDSKLESTDAKNKLEDLSGVVLKPGENPYHALIDTCHNDAAEIQTLYSTHRVTRNAQQKEKFLTSEFKEVIIDPFLFRLENPKLFPGFADPRNCMVLWARPPEHIMKLASHLQAMLKELAPNRQDPRGSSLMDGCKSNHPLPSERTQIPKKNPSPYEMRTVEPSALRETSFHVRTSANTNPPYPGLWLMPTHRMHLTALEVDHSRTPDEIAALLATLRPSAPALTAWPYAHRARLVKPMLSYDLAAIAVSFLPAAGEEVLSPRPVLPQPDDRASRDDGYTYHHLRRDLFGQVREAGVDIVSRYVVPSAHITLCRFLTQDDHASPEARQRWINKIDEINAWLEREVWDRKDGEFLGEWIVGQERGLDFRVGPLWYGGGRSIMLGEGF